MKPVYFLLCSKLLIITTYKITSVSLSFHGIQQVVGEQENFNRSGFHGFQQLVERVNKGRANNVTSKTRITFE